MKILNIKLNSRGIERRERETKKNSRRYECLIRLLRQYNNNNNNNIYKRILERCRLCVRPVVILCFVRRIVYTCTIIHNISGVFIGGGGGPDLGLQSGYLPLAALIFKYGL